MIIAKIALGLASTVAFATVYTMREGLISVQVDPEFAAAIDAERLHDLGRIGTRDVEARPDEPDRQALADAQAMAHGTRQPRAVLLRDEQLTRPGGTVALVDDDAVGGEEPAVGRGVEDA